MKTIANMNLPIAKWNVLIITSIVSCTSFASLTGTYNLVSFKNSKGSTSVICSDKLVIQEDSDSVSIKNTSQLGSAFNIDGSEGDLIIRQGRTESDSKNKAHGENFSSVTEANIDSNKIELAIETDETAFLITTSSAINTLTITKENNSLILNSFRSYNEKFSNSNDWEVSDDCLYSAE